MYCKKNLERRQLNTNYVEGLLPGLLMYLCLLISIWAVGGTNKLTACCFTSRTNRTNHTNKANDNNQLYTPTKKPSAQPNRVGMTSIWEVGTSSLEPPVMPPAGHLTSM